MPTPDAAVRAEPDCLSGKVALVTGGSRGIGRGIAEAFRNAGAQVMIVSRKADSLATTAAELGPQVAWRATHAGRPDEIAACVTETLDRLGGLDILVNNAATSPHQGPLVEIDLARFDKTMEVNLRGPLVWIQEAWSQYMSRHGGSIINISSVGSLRWGGPQGAYSLSKAGLDYLTRHMAVELAPRVRVNGLSPGIVPTDMSGTLLDQRVPPLGRVGTTADIANAAVFLASDKSAWITGCVVPVDGGAAVYDFDRGPKTPRPSALAAQPFDV
ncbi:MAG TPA: SDR family oxidoreductase [Acidimicrobiales bacterium]|nr:SDR family oxidoreductase [Acidimicrobiales bacterium]